MFRPSPFHVDPPYLMTEYLGLCERNVIILPLWESREETSIMGAAYHGSVGAAAM